MGKVLEKNVLFPEFKKEKKEKVFNTFFTFVVWVLGVCSFYIYLHCEYCSVFFLSDIFNIVICHGINLSLRLKKNVILRVKKTNSGKQYKKY